MDQQRNDENLASLHMLNNDCLKEIFGRRFLTASDQCAIADTCTRFRLLMQDVAPKNIILQRCDDKTFLTQPLLMRRFFRHFGSIAKSFSIEFDSVHRRDDAGRLIQQSWNFIRKYREKDSPELVFCVRMNGRLVLKIEPSMMWMCGPRYYGDDNALFMDCNSLNRLDITNVFDDSRFLKHFYPKLEHFTYEKAFADYESFFAVNEFISRHSTLKSISVWVSKTIGFSGRGGMVRRNLLHAIGKSCIFLKELKMNVGQTDEMEDLVDHMNATNAHGFDAEIRPLENLTSSLQRLTLTNIHDSFECFQPFTQLHELTLHNCLLPNNSNDFQFLGPLRRLRILSKLSTNPDLSMNYVIGMVRELPNLCYLKIFNESFKLDFSTYHRIVEIVENRTRKLTLECEKQNDLKPTDNSLKHVELR